MPRKGPRRGGLTSVLWIRASAGSSISQSSVSSGEGGRQAVVGGGTNG